METHGLEYPYDILVRARNERKRSHYHYFVYVIQLDSDVMPASSSRLNDSSLSCVYVGQSWNEPKVRYQQHLSGVHASRHVQNYGIQLLPQLYEQFNPLASREEAEEVEAALAEKLRREGFRVFGGH